MILVDTSVWIDHFRAANRDLSSRLTAGEVLAHPFVIGEIALGSVAHRADVLRYLANLPIATTATHDETMLFVERHKLASSGVGYVDSALLAAIALTRGAALWTRDKNLSNVATRCGLRTH